MALSTLLSTVCLPLCCDVPSLWYAFRRPTLLLSPLFPTTSRTASMAPAILAEAKPDFLFHETVTATSILGLPDTQRIRWRLMSGRICVCSFYAPHGGMDGQCRTCFWEELVASVRHTQQTLPATPIVLCGDANVWLPEFCLNRERQRYLVFPYVSELQDGCGLSLRNSLTRATHVAGATLDSSAWI